LQVGWIGMIGLMLKSQVGLGVLSIPSVFDTLGLIPGVILVLVIDIMATWSCYMVGVFKLRHREVYGIDDAGRLMFGRIGGEIFGTAYCICKFTAVPKSSDDGDLYAHQTFPLVRLYLHLRVRHSQYFHWSQRSVETFRLHRCFCGHWCRHWLHFF
jgi:hypothetical protein